MNARRLLCSADRSHRSFHDGERFVDGDRREIEVREGDLCPQPDCLGKMSDVIEIPECEELVPA